MVKDMMRRIAGTMSGTSLDGVDVAVIETDGHKQLKFLETNFRPYSDEEREIIRAAFGKWEGDEVDRATKVVEAAHIEALDGVKSELIGFHGQTVSHDPDGRGTLQLGDGQNIANATGKKTIWDFRTQDVALGGQGAPLAPFYHHTLARHIGADAPIVFLNLGGVGNMTWVNPNVKTPEAEGAILAFDTGPANALMDDFVKSRLGLPYDDKGTIARFGNVDENIVRKFLNQPYFFRVPPKSLDRNAFSALVEDVQGLSDEDALATLSACSTMGVVQGMAYCPIAPTHVYVAGGGRKNDTLIDMITAGIDCPLSPVEAVGLDGDFLEAQAFGHLGVRALKKWPTSCPSTTGVQAVVGGGQVSKPAK